MRPSGRKSLKYRGSHCLNCGHALEKTDVYCSQCSQLNSDKPLSASDFFNEFLSSIFVYDSRVWTTLRDLVWRPGVITRNYVKGQRLKYANPFRFFLSVSIIYFLLRSAISFFGFSDSHQFLNINLNNANNQHDADMIDSIRTVASENYRSTFYNDTLFAKKLDIAAYYPENALDSLSFFNRMGKKMDLFQMYFKKHRKEPAETGLANLEYNPDLMNKWLYSRVISQDKLMSNPGAFVYYILAKIPFFLFFFTPLFALAFLIFYPRKKFSYMEHIIFIFHIFSFVFLALTCFSLLDLMIGGIFFIKLLFLLIGPVYFFLALFNFYGQRIRMTLFKFFALSLVFNLFFFAAVFLFVAAGAAIY